MPRARPLLELTILATQLLRNIAVIITLGFPLCGSEGKVLSYFYISLTTRDVFSSVEAILVKFSFVISLPVNE